MRKKNIIIVVLLALLLGGAGVLFLSRDSGPPVQVIGNLSTKDVTQIKKTVRHRLWRDALPGFSMQTVKALPKMIKRAWTVQVIRIAGDQHRATAYFSGSGHGIDVWVDGYELTNGTAGWCWISDHFWVVPD
jgi:hypothetical protein